MADPLSEPRSESEGAGWTTLVVPPAWAGKRVDMFVAAHSPDDISRARVQALVREGSVTVNDAVPRGTSVKVAAGDAVCFRMPPPVDPVPKPEAIPLVVLHEDADLIVIDKPAGLVVHPSPGNETGTLVNALIHHCGGELSGIGGVRRPGIVHRLDRDTTGVMVAAKSYRAHVDLVEQFADHGRTGPLERAYRALAWGVPARAGGTIETWLGRSRHNRFRRAVVDADAPDAKHAVTHWRALEPFEIEGRPVASLVECRLETGRTHQIRVHLAHHGHPIVGDRDYAAGFATKAALLPGPARAAHDALGRQALHAALLGFRHPRTGETMRFEAPLPADMARLVDTLRNGSTR